ncbi:MAG: FapA family protein [Pseudomonadota bacterium]|nr:FapA family protein [Pseudomonadota bacterium]
MPYRVTLLFGKEPSSDPDSREAVDHYRSSIASQIAAGQTLARLHPLTAVESDSSNKPISADNLTIQDRADIISSTVELAEDDGQLVVVSKINGFPSLVEQQIVVHKNLTIEKDINFHTGNIDCPGDLLIKGSIMSGFKVKAENLTVTGSIENAEVECRGNLVCAGGIVACNDYPLICGDNLWCKYLENSRIEVKNNIFIAGSSLHSFLKAGNNIVLCHSSAVLVGGKSEAGNSLYSGILGAKWATPTEIILGCEPFLAKKLDDHNQQLEKLETELEELHERVEQINTFLQHEEGRTTPHDAHRLQEERELIESKLNYIMQKHKVGLTKRDDLTNRIGTFKKTNSDCNLHVSKHLFSGIRLTIKDAETRIEEESPPTILTVDDLQGEIINSR